VQDAALILHGKDDPRVNPGQSRELYRHSEVAQRRAGAARALSGRGPRQSQGRARFDYELRMEQWIEHYLTGPKGEPPPMEVDYGEPKPAGAAN
jgi:hypothetical protein